MLTLKFAMGYSGLSRVSTIRYVRPAWRNQGLSRAALFEVQRFCETVGVRTITIKVDHNNGPDQRVYRRAGFAKFADRQRLTLAFAASAHTPMMLPWPMK